MASPAHEAKPLRNRDGLVLHAGPPPHIRSGLTRRAINLALVLGLGPALVAAVAIHGWGALGRLGLAAGAAMLLELLTQKLLSQPVRVSDLSALVQGLLLALLLPPDAPAWLIVIGVAVMIIAAKQLFGGVGAYPFNPVLIAWAVLLLSWGNRVHPVGGELLGTAWTPGLAIGGLILVTLGHVDWRVPFGLLLGVIGAALLFGAVSPGTEPWQTQLMMGSVFLGAFFLATDTTCSPANPWPRLAFGFGAGVMIIVLRTYGIWPEPVPFALLLMNALTPLLDRMRPRPRQRIVRHA